MRRRKNSHGKTQEILKSPLGTRIPMSALMQALAVAEYLNFRHAAAALGISQSSVSSRIKALEVELGITLFERRHRGVRLTEAGRRFVAEVSIGIDQIEYAVKSVGAVSKGLEGRLEIGSHASIASGFLAELHRRYRSDFPAIEQVITEGKSSDIIPLVREGTLDIAFVVGFIDAPDCHSRSFWSENWIVALPESHPLAHTESLRWADLTSETFLARCGGAGPQVFEHAARRFVELGTFPYVRKCDVGRDTLLHMVAAGDGISLTSEAIGQVPLPGVVFRTLADETERARFSAVWSPHNSNPALRKYLEIAKEMSRSSEYNQK